MTVDSSVPEKFGSMLKAALKALALVLELTCVEDIGKVLCICDMTSTRT